MSRILVVEDDPMVRTTIRRMLGGHEVVEAENGKVALEALARQDFDLVITDLMMPERAGVALIGDIRARGVGPKILAISGGGRMSGADLLPAAQQAGADAVLAKPFRKAELLRVIATLLA
jgi:CheY-like chemotaxis protein